MGLDDTVLIIGDEENLRTTLGEILRRAGYVVTIMSQAGEALQSLQETCYDLVFLDLKMKELNGINLLPEIRRRHPGIPVILLTAGAPYDPVDYNDKTTPVGYLLKPIDPARIISYTDETLCKSRQVKGDVTPAKVIQSSPRKQGRSKG